MNKRNGIPHHQPRDDINLIPLPRKGISGFLLKTYQMVMNQILENQYEIKYINNFIDQQFIQNPEFQDIISFNGVGNAFIVKNQNVLSENVLPQQFKHQNYSSFIRQLNMYGFKKIRNVNNQNEFSHYYFLRGREDLLSSIVRKNGLLERYKLQKRQSKANKEARLLQKNYNNLRADLDYLKKELGFFHQQFDQFQNTLMTLADSSRQQLMELSVIKNKNSTCNDLLYEVLGFLAQPLPQQKFNIKNLFAKSAQQTQTTKSSGSDKDYQNGENENNNISSKEDTNQSVQSNSSVEKKIKI